MICMLVPVIRSDEDVGRLGTGPRGAQKEVSVVSERHLVTGSPAIFSYCVALPHVDGSDAPRGPSIGLVRKDTR